MTKQIKHEIPHEAIVTGEELERQFSQNFDKVCNSLAGYLKQERSNKHVSLRQLCKAVGVSSSLISDFENGQKLPRLDTLIKIATFLGVRMSDIFNEEISGALPKATVFNEIQEAKSHCDGYALTIVCKHLGYSTKEISELLRYDEFIKYNRNRKKRT